MRFGPADPVTGRVGRQSGCSTAGMSSVKRLEWESSWMAAF
jgi:hypothetical protein